MGYFRQPYGSALGFENQFRNVYGNTAGLFTSGDATPDVTYGDLFIVNNTASTVITHFDLQDYAKRAASYQGKVIRLLILDQGSTQLANSGQLYLQSTDNLLSKNAFTFHEFVFFNSSWIQSDNANQNRRGTASVDIGGTLGIDADDRQFISFVGTGGATNTLQSLSNGQVGQVLYVTVRSGGANVVVNSAGNIYIGGTNAVTLLSNNLYTFLKADSARWFLSRENLFV